MRYKIIFLFLFITGISFSQWQEVPVSLFNSSNIPITGKAAVIKFVKSPYSYPADIVTGITVTEESAGYYLAVGFTTLQLVKLYVDGVEQTWFGKQLTGDMITYISANYWTRATTQGSLTGNKTITAGDWLMTGGTFTINKPYIYSGSTWVSDYSLVSNYGLIWQSYADSVYGIKGWYYDGTKLRMNSSSYKWYGRTSTTAPFEINSSHFNWTSDKLNLLSSAVNVDSIKHNNVTIGKDTTWYVLGEPVTKWKFLSLKKPFYNTTHNNYYDWKLYYKSFNESGTLVALDSSILINNVSEIDQDENVQLQYDGTYSKIDSVLLDAGTYTINFSIMYERENHNNIAVIGIKDTIEIALKLQGSAPNTYIKRFIRNIFNYNSSTDMNGGVLSWQAKYQIETNQTYVYLYARYLATDLSNALAIGVTTTIRRGSIVATLVR